MLDDNGQPVFSLKKFGQGHVAEWGSFVRQAPSKEAALQSLSLAIALADEHHLEHHMPPRLRQAVLDWLQKHADLHQQLANSYRVKAERVAAQGKRKRLTPC